jgi:cysteine desulfurase/selenocysteine lyase
MSANSILETGTQLDIQKIRADFPILQTQVYGKPLVYLDNAATTQKPKQVLDSIQEYYTQYNSNVHRGVHYLSQKATTAYEETRKKATAFINAKHNHEVIFTRGTTDGINLVASSFGRKFLNAGDSIVISAIEHHSNIVPWQMICEERGASIKVIPVNEKGELVLETLDELLDDKVKLVALTYISNTLGTINPVKEVIARAHQQNIPVLVDAAQAAPHLPLDVQDLDVDFMAFSAHKMYGPTGFGALYGKEDWLNQMPPYQGGGDMIKSVSFQKTTYNVLPLKFEAGTPSIAEAIAFGAAIDYIQEIGIANIQETESQLYAYAVDALRTIDEIRFIGEARNRAASISFLVGDAHPFDIGEILDKQGIAVRTGHHCTEPIMQYFNIPGTVRASIAVYNTKEEIDKLVIGIKKAITLLS